MKKIGITLGIVLVFALGAFIWMTDSAKKELDTMVYEDVDMSLVADGTIMYTLVKTQFKKFLVMTPFLI